MVNQNLTKGHALHTFRIETLKDIPELRSQAAVFTHEKTGARLLHLFNDDPNNLFCICFRTPVYNNTGVPHILEHSVLSGSRKFPLKDPFKEMLKGSLQTFLNAITYPDRTMYPVSSQVQKDFFNLVNVYCDAVFNPLLTEITFAQEGWHFDLESPDAQVFIKGIVYNEMKGVFSDFRSHVARKTMSALFPDTTYYYESGGDPEYIPGLTYEQFREFHKQYYHPSNSFIILYGNIPSEKTLAFLQENYLKSFDHRSVESEIKPQQLWREPQSITISAPAPKEDDGTASVIVSWLHGSSTDPLTSLLGRIFSHYMFDNESSPMRRALIDSKLGEDLDDMCGFDSDLVQGLFCAGLRKTKPEHAEEIRSLILKTIENEVNKKLDSELLEGSIRQIEFRLREITEGGHFPYNLMLAERALRSWIYGGDPLAHLCFEETINIIKKKKKEGTAFFADAMRDMFLNNKHNLLTIIKASSELGEQLGKKSEEQAARLSSTFTKKDREKYSALTGKFIEEQKKQPSPEALASLPKLNRSDLPKENEKVPTEMESIDGITVYTHPLFTAGIVYLDVGFDLSTIPCDLLPYFSIYSELLTRCGAAGFSPEQMAKRVSLSTGGINSSDMCTTRFGTEDDLVFKFFFHGKVLPERFDEMVDIFVDVMCKPELDNAKLLHDILFELRNDMNAAVIRSGHSFAIANAASRLSKSKYIDEVFDGISQLRFLDKLVRKKDIDSIAEAMGRLHDIVINRTTCFASMTTEEPDRFLKSLDSFFKKLPSPDINNVTVDYKAKAQESPVGIEISSSVNYVARSWRLRKLTPDIIGQIFLMSRNLATGYLWDKVRVEGGAYGGMAVVSSSHPVFSCASYRDPNLVRTLDNFQAGIEKVAKGLSEEEVDQSVIGATGRFDQPRSPHGKGFGETVALLCGRSPETRQQIRNAVQNSTPDILAKRAAQLLDEKESAITVLGSTDAFDNAEKEGFKLNREHLLESE